jgi:hypothetical protein
MKIPDSFLIEDGAYAMDGGSIAIHLRDLEGDEHDIVLRQHMFTEVNDPDRLPGRLYFDGTLIPVRDEWESQIIRALRQAPVKSSSPKSTGGEKRLDSGPGVIVGNDIKEYMSKIDESPVAALSHLVRQLIDYVESADYVELARKLNAGDK